MQGRSHGLQGFYMELLKLRKVHFHWQNLKSVLSMLPSPSDHRSRLCGRMSLFEDTNTGNI